MERQYIGVPGMLRTTVNTTSAFSREWRFNYANIPASGTATINELPRTGFIFTSATTADGAAGTRLNRLISFNVCGNAATTGCSTALGNLNGGGSATVYVVAGPDGGITTNGGTAAQTTVFFNNRTAPGQLKICKIAGPGVPEFTVFNFDVVGTGPTPPVTTVTPVPVSGTAQPGASLNIGQPNNQTVSVFAGPAASNGYCQVATGFFVVDSTATITEQQTPNTAAGAVRVSRITSTGMMRVTMECFSRKRSESAAQWTIVEEKGQPRAIRLTVSPELPRRV